MTTIAVGLILGLLLWLAKKREQQRAPPPPIKDRLDAPLMQWSPRDDFSLRDLVRSVCIMGASGSGKSSAIGRMLAKAMASRKDIGMLIIASKPEDRAAWESVAREAERPLIVIGPGESQTFNFIEHESKNGADARELTQVILTAAESLTRNDGGNGEKFWKFNAERLLQSGIEPLLQATGKLDLWELQQFINDAPQSKAQLTDREWRAGLFFTTMDIACKKPKTAIAAHDLELANEFFSGEWAVMNDRTRSSILADVMGRLHVFNTGVVRQILGGGSTFTPEAFDEGAWVLVDMPVANHGAAGSIVAGAMKLSTQKHILRRTATENTAVTVIWSDEYQNNISSFDAKYLAQSRSHLGGMIVLTQSIHSFFSSIGGREVQSNTKALLTNFGIKIAMALGDEESAKYFASLVGQDIIRLAASSRSGPAKLFNELNGDFNLGTTLTEQISELILPRLFMNGHKTGGPENNFIATGWVIRNGEPFSSGENAILCGFSQK